MSYLLFDVLFLGLPVALMLLWAGRLPARLTGATAALAVVALVWTAPWDEHLVRSGVWSYGGDRVLARLGSVPAEEYLFVVLEVLLIASWGHLLHRLHPRTTPSSPTVLLAASATRRRGAAALIAVLALGAALLVAGGPYRYLGLLLVWVAPPMLLQRAVAGDLLRARLADRALIALPVALWLCAADRLALADGIWSIAPASSTGVLLLGLPIEEGLFFVLTCVLVTDGLVLATDERAVARAGALLRRRPTAGTATSRPSAPRSAPAASLPGRTSR
ncbi:MAG: lycopene cyclase domain-containing protein [Frankiaceae bacterium]|nr:lycopene cyclase domain-containing protein [Frankiaceae bacterium]